MQCICYTLTIKKEILKITIEEICHVWAKIGREWIGKAHWHLKIHKLGLKICPYLFVLFGTKICVDFTAGILSRDVTDSLDQ